MPHRRDPRSPMNIDPDIPALREQSLTRVQPNAHTHRAGGQSRLRIRGRRDRIRRTPERDEERVPLRVHLHPMVALEGPAQHLPVLSESIGIPLTESANKRVEPSTSVNKNVTVPVGNSTPR